MPTAATDALLAPALPADPAGALRAAPAAPRAHRPAFGTLLAAARAEASPRERARGAAEEFVAQALVFPVLKQAREMNRAPAPFGPGPYEKNIASLFDADTAARIVRASNFPLVESVARFLEQHARPGGPARTEGAIDGFR